MTRPCSQRWWRHYLVALVPSAAIAALCMRRILERAGEPALPLDDSFIHLQFAKQLASGHWFHYTQGGGYSSGATSFLWPASFVPFFWLGLRDLDLVWVAWIFGTLLHAAVAYETWRLGRGLLGDMGAIAAGAMCTVFGAFAWFAFSGMETIAITWMLVRGARVASEYWEKCQATRERPSVQLALLGALAPMVRPEGALVSFVAALTLSLSFRRMRGKAWSRALAIAFAAAGPLLVPLSHWAFTGHAASSTAMVKHLAFDPYLTKNGVIEETLANAKLLVTNLLQGGPWTALFLPEGFAYPLALGIVAMPLLARRERAGWRALTIAAIVLGTFGPTTYATMLWNRVRYIWPFAPGWFLVVAAGFVEIGYRLGRRAKFASITAPAACWGAVAMLSMKLDWATADLATSARAISKQQVWLGKWAAHNLPADAIIGVNDTGAIAYMSGRRTFDVVGLTTEGEAPYWAAGPGARFEHWERVRARGGTLPSHLFVYRNWMAMQPIYGAWLTEATVVDQSILGGRTMTAMVADYELLGTGEQPFTAGLGTPTGTLDVGDLESERQHRYDLGDGKSHFCVAHAGDTPDGRVIADGGRVERADDRFFLGSRGPVQFVMRVSTTVPLEVWADDKRVGEARTVADTGSWQELEIGLPNGAEWIVVRGAQPKRFTSFHYWWFRHTK
jgi:hypothetical protein